ncbi:CoA transferase [Candidatus Woesearchaeota archaeon]|nr:CoA transferase [Candidatus Woesearchaeota archaeon]
MLKGINVLDLSNLLPGPMCSLLLAELGADVIKVESPSGDPMRYFENVNGKNPYFAALNRNKKSISLNLKADEGKKIFMALAKDADVIIEGFRPGKVDALGIGYKAVKKINPGIVYCSITGYGQKGAYRNKAGHDLNYASLSGMLDAMFQKPIVAGVQVPDTSSALVSAFAIVASLLSRQKSGRGCYIDVAVLDTALFVIGIHMAYRSVSENIDTVLSGSKPCYSIYKTKDGEFVSLGAIEKKFWVNFCSAIGREELIGRQFDSSREIAIEMQAVFKSKKVKEWMEISRRHDFCCEPVKKMGSLAKDSHFKGRKMLEEVDGISLVKMPVEFSSHKKIACVRHPKLGENAKGLLKKMGYSKSKIMELQSRGVII